MPEIETQDTHEILQKNGMKLVHWRMTHLTPEQRSEQATKANLARWKRQRGGDLASKPKQNMPGNIEPLPEEDWFNLLQQYYNRLASRARKLLALKARKLSNEQICQERGFRTCKPEEIDGMVRIVLAAMRHETQ